MTQIVVKTEDYIEKIGGLAKLYDGYPYPVCRDTKSGEMRTIVRFDAAERRVLRKKKSIQPSKWAERHRVLPKSARFSGLWRNTTFPYLAGIMDASFEKCVEEIVLCAAPQTGKTECVYTCIGYAADTRPGPVMINFPTETDARDNSSDRLQAMFEDSPRLRGYLTGYKDDMSSLKITLSNMIIYMAWANSPSRLANRPAMYLFGDEVEKYPVTAGKKEGSPIDLLRKRMTTYSGIGKLWLTSSPSIETGPIWVALTNECQAVFDYWVKCPFCGKHQKMLFGNEGTPYGIKWPSEIRDPVKIEQTHSVWYLCDGCATKWTDVERDLAVRAGAWRDKKNNLSIETVLRSLRPHRIGFHLPAWLSPVVPMWKCVAAFLRGQKDKTKLKDFQNGFAAEPWKVFQEQRNESQILALRDSRPRGRVPGGGVVAAMTAGIDTQDYGFWYEIRAWGWGGVTLSKESWCIREGYVESFEELRYVLFEDSYTDPDGRRYVLNMAIQDAMGHRTSEVYDFCRKNRVVPSKGYPDMAGGQSFRWANQEFYPGGKKPIPGGLKRIDINTKFFKDELHRLLQISAADPGAWHYHAEFPEAHAMHMTAEYVGEKETWECPGHKQNHLWDCAVLNLCAHEVLGVRHRTRPGEEQKAMSKRRIVSRGVDA